LQSERKGLYLSYAVELLKNGRAYPCFATKDELDKNYEEQQRAKVRPGYYGTWALWREKTDEDINAALDAGKDFVLRFRSEGSHEKRVSFEDALKGHLELPENDLDVPLIKNDGSQLPTYHLAHVVDDYLMKTNIILRGDEWLPSTPLHMELSDALGMPRFRYAHFAPISVLDKGGKRKLSKRKDPEADVQFWLSVGYPLKGVKAYLLGLANSNFEEWYREHSSDALEDFAVSLEKLAASRAPLLDHSKLNDYCKDVIAAMPQGDFTRAVLDFSASHVAVREDAVTTSNTFNTALLRDAKYTNEVLSLERAGDKPRKDIAKWNDAYEQYGYFFDEEFEKNFKPGIAAVLGGLEKHANSTCMAFLKTYNPGDEQPVWFEKLKHAAESAGFCVDNKAYREDQKLPESERKYIGNTADFAKILRVRLTGKDRTPDLCAIMKVMQHERVVARLGS
jgi:glutamyl-tRNA synthetase